MGILRTLFALAVVLAHSFNEDVLVGGRNAVQLFYMISGYLISFVLVEKKAYPSVRSFYVNRYLRLYPIYIVVALLTLLAFSVVPNFDRDGVFFGTYHASPLTADLLLGFSNATLFLQDWVMFSGVEAKHLVFTTNFWASEVQLWHGLLVPQAWTLGVELTFYLVAPFILPRRRTLLILLCLSLLLRLYLWRIGLGNKDPWTYRFFPTEIALFLFGALAHQLLMPWYQQVMTPGRLRQASLVATGFLIALTLSFSFIPVHDARKNAALFVLFFLLMPLSIVFQSRRRWDKWIGDLSYPIYISHMLVIYVSTFALAQLAPTTRIFSVGGHILPEKVLLSVLAVVFSTSFAIVLNKFIGGPVEALRDRFREKQPLRS